MAVNEWGTASQGSSRFFGVDERATCGKLLIFLTTRKLRRLFMKFRMFALFLCLSIAAVAMAKEIELPDSCGDPNTKFDVTTQKSATVLPAPDAGKSLIVFLEPNEEPCLGCYTQRFAMDGKWVGATKKHSYFTLQVEPGQHHFCSTGVMRNTIAIRSFEVKAGGTYFLQARWIPHGGGATSVWWPHDRGRARFSGCSRREKRSSLWYVFADEEKGRYLIKSYDVADFKKK